MSEFGMMDNESGEALALRGVEVFTRITGLLASTTLVQKYKNDTDTNLELSYAFPTPVSGTLLSFEVTVGERKYNGQVVSRAEAEVKYEEAIDEGNSAFRLQEIRPGMYNAELGNVMSGEEVEITLTYAEPLPWNDKRIRYRLPTTIAPRYGTPEGMQPWQRPIASPAAEYPLDIKISITGDLAQSAVSCPSHKVSMKMQPDALIIQLAKGATMDRDFILDIENGEVSSLGCISSARGTNVAMLTLLPPEVDGQNNQRDVVLLIDCSGSMQGDSIVLAKEGVLLALGSLEPSEHFGLIAFGTSFLQFDKELQPANRKNLDMARDWVNNLPSLGGTDINGALDLAHQLQGNKAMDILLLTDGQVWNSQGSVAMAKAKGNRIFTVGIGSAVAEDAIQKMADETGGACELVTPTEGMSERIYRHFNRMRQPTIGGIEIIWPCTPAWESLPSHACYTGDAYTVFTALPDSTVQEIEVRFKLADKEPQAIIVPLRPEVTSADAIVRLAAKQRLATLDEEQRLPWAIAYQIITDNTDYLVVLERSADEKATKLPELQIQPQMLPAGWGGTSSIHSEGIAPWDVHYSPVLLPPIELLLAPEESHDNDNSEVVLHNILSVLRGNNSENTGLPLTLSALLEKSLPLPLVKFIKERLAAGDDEATLLCSFYAALATFGAADRALCKEIDSKVERAQANGVITMQLLDILTQLSPLETSCAYDHARSIPCSE